MKKQANDQSTSSLLDLTSEEMQALASDMTQPFMLRKMIEMVSSENQAIAMQAIKYIKEREQPPPAPALETDDSISNIVINMGIVGYPLEKILSIIPDDIDRKYFMEQFEDPTSEIARWYKKGIDIADFDIDMRLYELAKSGDLNALQVFEKRKRLRSLDD